MLKGGNVHPHEVELHLSACGEVNVADVEYHVGATKLTEGPVIGRCGTNIAVVGRNVSDIALTAMLYVGGRHDTGSDSPGEP